MESYTMDMRRIVITGPESSGKTTLALGLAHALHGSYVIEVAREYLDALGRPYEEKDLLAIAREQLEREEVIARDTDTGGLLVCDTDLITIRIWSEEKYGRCDPWIIEQTVRRPYDLWLLCSPDMPWEPDPLRENPDDRDRLFDVYERTLRALGKPYRVMIGDPATRLREATNAMVRPGI
ncbi:MAG TPA: ATP-binding protein [Flavobacteriales bacterium]|nr:ATP-binding protein [Flavobacteriales bacterium]